MIRIGVVGCGRIFAAHLRGYRLLREAGVDGFRITALCDCNEENARMYIKRGEGPSQRHAVSDRPGDPLAVGDEYISDFQDDAEVKVYTDYRHMIAEGRIDAVNDFSTHPMHHQVASAAFEHQKHLLTQKPLAITVAAASRMCDEAEDANLILGVFENARFRPSTRHLRWLLESGRYGTPQMVLLGNAGAWWAPDRIVAETPWRHRRIEAGGISLDLGVHQFHMIRHVAGTIKDIAARTAILEPERVTRDAEGKVTQRIPCDADDTFYAHFSTENGVTGNLFASWGGHGAPTVLGEGLVIYGSWGRVAGNTVTFDDKSTADLAELYKWECDPERIAKEFPLGLIDEFALAQYDWLEAVRNHREPETSGREGLMDLACAYGILESAQAGRGIAVKDVLDGSLDAYQRPINEHFQIS